MITPPDAVEGAFRNSWAGLAVRRRMRLTSTSDAAGGVITSVPLLLPPPLLLLTLLLLLLPAVCGQASWPKLLME